MTGGGHEGELFSILADGLWHMIEDLKLHLTSITAVFSLLKIITLK